MELQLYNNERARLFPLDESVFVDLNAHLGSSMLLGIEFYEMHKFQIRKKNRGYKLFIFKDNHELKTYKFDEFWGDAEVVLEN